MSCPHPDDWRVTGHYLRKFNHLFPLLNTHYKYSANLNPLHIVYPTVAMVMIHSNNVTHSPPKADNGSIKRESHPVLRLFKWLSFACNPHVPQVSCENLTQACGRVAMIKNIIELNGSKLFLNTVLSD